jgi:hypothetical protein
MKSGPGHTEVEVSACFTYNVHKFRVSTTVQIENAAMESDSIMIAVLASQDEYKKIKKNEKRHY